MFFYGEARLGGVREKQAMPMGDVTPISWKCGQHTAP